MGHIANEQQYEDRKFHGLFSFSSNDKRKMHSAASIGRFGIQRKRKFVARCINVVNALQYLPGSADVLVASRRGPANVKTTEARRRRSQGCAKHGGTRFVASGHDRAWPSSLMRSLEGRVPRARTSLQSEGNMLQAVNSSISRICMFKQLDGHILKLGMLFNLNSGY